MPIFRHPAPAGPAVRLRPVFLPYAGCPHRCAFCSQHAQSGQGQIPLGEVFSRLAAELARAAEGETRSCELGFFGGTFTALPEPWIERFLALAAQYRDRGLITRVRCSTRPDAVSKRLLARLKSLGLDAVELGVQSFDDQALAAAGRGYGGDAAREGCRTVREAGLALCLHLMPGLPGDRPGLFRADVEAAVAAGPESVRLHPCLVLAGTRLATAWKSGGYAPWDLERTRRELSLALLRLWEGGVAVSRIGLAPEPSLVAAVLAGPWHPALGQMVRAQALFEVVRRMVQGLGRPPRSLLVPCRHAGELFGQGRELAAAYAGIGLPAAAIEFQDRPDFALE